MLAKIHNNENIFDGSYVFEPKLDGYRALCFKNSSLKFFSRNGNNLTADFPELQSPEKIKAKTSILDGEIVVYDNKGVSNFNLIQNRKGTAFFVIFDILMLDGRDLTSLPLLERKKILKKIIKETGNFQLSFYTEKGKKLISETKKRKFEGVMAKKKLSKYSHGRSSDWLKIKFIKTIDCVIIGYTSQKREISSLLLGLYKNKKLIFIGKVGTGFNEKILNELKEKFKKLTTRKSLNIKEKNVSWLKPKLVAEIKFSEITPDKKLRAPVFLKLRDDKDASECKISQIFSPVS